VVDVEAEALALALVEEDELLPPHAASAKLARTTRSTAAVVLAVAGLRLLRLS
jgi:hypothetical protein